VIRQPIQGYVCPSDGKPRTNTNCKWTFNSVTDNNDQNPALCNYVGVAGTWRSERPNNGGNNGCLHINSGLTMGDLSDGTSNTMGVSERSSRLGQWNYGAAVWAGCSNIQHNKDAYLDALAQTYWPPNQPQISGDWDYYYSSILSDHPGGVNALLMDGSVTFIGETIDHQQDGDGNVDGTWERLACREDGQSLGEF
jgi:prepilin-type processing-associated H-X9-DG protein